MKKTNLIKVFSILLVTMMIILFATTVNAADDTGFNDLTDTLLNNNSSNNTTGNNSTGNNTTNNATGNNILGNTNSNNNSNNLTVYNNTNSTNLPKTGIGDSIPVSLLLVVFGVSSVYAYIKIKEYKNI